MYTSETRTARMMTESVVVNTAKLTKGTLIMSSDIAGRDDMDLNTIELARRSCTLRGLCGLLLQLKMHR